MASGAVSGSRSFAASENKSPTAPKYAAPVTGRDATEVPPGHGAGAEAENEYAPVLPRRSSGPPSTICGGNELTELAKQDD